MKFQVTTDYAIRVIHYLGGRTNDLPTAEEIAAETSITYPYLIRVANQLKKAGLVETERGRYGGYRLACDLSDIYFIDIVEAMEGKFSLCRRGEQDHYGSRDPETCPGCQALQGLEAKMESYMRSICIADLREAT